MPAPWASSNQTGCHSAEFCNVRRGTGPVSTSGRNSERTGRPYLPANDAPSLCSNTRPSNAPRPPHWPIWAGADDGQTRNAWRYAARMPTHTEWHHSQLNSPLYTPVCPWGLWVGSRRQNQSRRKCRRDIPPRDGNGFRRSGAAQ